MTKIGTNKELDPKKKDKKAPPKKKKRKGTVNNLGVIEENKQETLRAAQKKAKIEEKQLKYENLGYNSIVETLTQSEEKNCLTSLNRAIENEVDWVCSTVGRVLDQGQNSHSRNGTYSSLTKGRHRASSNNFSYSNFDKMNDQSPSPAKCVQGSHLEWEWASTTFQSKFP